jgi:UDP-glucose 4-epimerase
MNILVIGGNGFIGSHLVDHLLLKGHSVRVFDNSYEHFRKPLSNVDYRISSLDNIPDLYESLLGIDIVYHLASSSVPSTSNIDTVTDVTNNLVPTLNILNLMVKIGIKRIVFFSSGGAVYGIPETLPVPEEHPIKPISSYGIVKAMIERYLFLYQRMHEIQPLIIRPSNPYGPRQGHYMAQGVISTFLRKIKYNECLTVYGDGHATKDYIYISDLIELSYELSMREEIGVYNIGSGKGISLSEIIAEIKNITGKNPIIEKIDEQAYDVNHFVLDISKVTNILEIRPTVSLSKGIEKLWSWINTLE